MKRNLFRISKAFGYLIFSITTCIFLFPALLQAKALGEQEVKAAVETWVRYLTADARPDAFIERMEPHKVKEELIAYIAHLPGSGFCICGADELVLPVYLYSPKGIYDHQNPNYQYILWEIETRLKYLRDGLEKRNPQVLQYQTVLSERSEYWQNLIAGHIPDKIERQEGVLEEPFSMKLDLTSRWHQRSPYNAQCPVLTPPNEHAVVGCVATAMSQIMYYWKWPNTGQGDADVDYTYRWRNNWDEEPLLIDPKIPLDLDSPWVNRLEWTNLGGGKLRMNGYWDESLYESAKGIPGDNYTALDDYLNALKKLWNRLTNDASKNYYANFSNSNYNWNIMEEIHTDWDPKPGDAEVAKLCHHAGVAIGMDYGITASGAPGDDVDNALQDHFRYDSDAHDSERNIEKMTEEIQWFRPVAFGGSREAPKNTVLNGKVGHEWVLLGYDKATDPNRQFLMNLGWGGLPAWYSCDSLFPIDQDHVTHLAPKDVVKFVGATNPGDGSPDDPFKDIEEAILEAPNGATLIFKAGSVNTFSTNTLVINRPLIFKGYNIIIGKN